MIEDCTAIILAGGNSKRMGGVMAGLMDDLKAEHPSVGDYPQRLYRAIY